MDPGSETCCFNGEGVREITYHNTATIPTVAEEWTTYYEDAGYLIPTTTGSAPVRTFPATEGSSISTTSTTSTTMLALSQSLNVPQAGTKQEESIATFSVSASTFPASKGTTISSASTPMPAKSQSVNLPQAVSNQPAPTTTPEPTPISAAATAIVPREKVVIGTASALGVLGTLVLVGLLHQIRRSRNKRLEKKRSELAPEVVTSEETELMGLGAPTQALTRWDRPSKGAPLSGPNEIIGRDGKGWIAELSG